MKQQQGFTLVAVLIMAAMAGVLVLNSMRDNQIQERLTGNYQKKLNSRLVAEKGVFDSQQAIINLLAGSPGANIDDIIRVGTGETNLLTGEAGIDNMSYSANVIKNADGLIEISSDGTRFEGASNMVALFEYVKGSSASYPFEQFLVGCSGVGVKAGGSVDSYDSRDPNAAHSNKANISTLNKDSDVSIAGGALVWGDVSTTRNIEVVAGTSVAGTLHANGNITISGGGGVELPEGTIEGTRVTEDILARGNVDFVGGVGGVVKALGDITYGSSSNTFITNQNSEALALMYGGLNLSIRDISDTPTDNEGTHLNANKFRVEPTVDVVQAVDPDNIQESDLKNPKKSCDFLQISTELNNMKLNMDAFDDLDLSKWDSRFEISSVKGAYTRNAPRNAATEFLPRTKTVFGASQNVFFFNKVNINGGRLVFKKSSADNESETIHLFVADDFVYSTSGGTTDGSQIEIQEGVSVVVYILGKAQFKKPFSSAGTEGFRTTSKTPSFTLFSAYNETASSTLNCNSTRGPWGIEMSGTGDMYGVIYAPKSDVFVGSSTTFKGAVRANTITACGAGSIHYDVALGEYSVGGGSSGAASKLVFKGWRY